MVRSCNIIFIIPHKSSQTMLFTRTLFIRITLKLFVKSWIFFSFKLSMFQNHFRVFEKEYDLLYYILKFKEPFFETPCISDIFLRKKCLCILNVILECIFLFDCNSWFLYKISACSFYVKVPSKFGGMNTYRMILV